MGDMKNIIEEAKQLCEKHSICGRDKDVLLQYLELNTAENSNIAFILSELFGPYTGSAVGNQVSQPKDDQSEEAEDPKAMVTMKISLSDTVKKASVVKILKPVAKNQDGTEVSLKGRSS